MSKKPEFKKVTAREIGEAVGVDKSAVYQALSGRGRISPLRREEILRTAETLGYQVDHLAQRLRAGRSRVDVPIFSYFLDRGVLVETVSRIQTLLTNAGYIAPLHIFVQGANGGLSQLEIIRRIHMERPRALICAESFYDEASLEEMARFQKSGGHVITVGFASKVQCDQVIFSEEGNTYMAVKHLLELGHKRIGYCTQGTFSEEHSRVYGLKRALAEFGVPFDRKWMFDGLQYEDAGVSCATQFLAMTDRPSAMAIVNDISAIAFMAELNRHGLRVPQDVSVIGHDGLPDGAHSFIRLSTVTRPAAAIARAVLQLLTDRLEGAYIGPFRTLEVRGELVIRESTAPYISFPGETPISSIPTTLPMEANINENA